MADADGWDMVADVLGLGGPHGNDHGSSNWAAWGHAEIRSMLDDTVDPGDIGDAARAWGEQGRNTADVITGFTRDLNGIVSGGWRGESADAAIAAFAPIQQWSAMVADTADRTTALMSDSGSSAGKAKVDVPPPQSHDWGQSLRSFATGGVVGVVVDAVAQEQQEADARAEAVRVMNSVYSAPINDYRAAVPTYPQLVDPTLQPPDQFPNAGPAPGTLYSGAGAPGAGVQGAGVQSAGTAGAGAAGSGVGEPGGGSVPQVPPAAAELQGVTGGGGVPTPHGGQIMPDITRVQHVGGQLAAGVPLMTPIAGGGDVRGGRTAGGVRTGGGGGSHSGGGGHQAGIRSAGAGRPDFGPRPSGTAEPVVPGRGASAAAAGRGGLGGGFAPMGAARGGAGGADAEHRRPAYLIEMDDVFSDGRKVAPPVIGEDPPRQDG